MRIDIKKKIIKLFLKDCNIVIKNDEVITSTINITEPKQPVFKPERYMYIRFEKIKIDENFKYYNYDLTGDAKTDFDHLFGINDSHGSLKVLEHSFRENYLKIQRSHDIGLAYENGVYNIYNGRHRLVYLKSFYDAYHYKGSDFGYEAPALVSYYINDENVNSIISSLKKEYNAKIYKGNYYDDEASFFMIIDKKLYIVKSREELEEFFKFYNDNDSDEKYFISDISFEKNFLVEDIFQSIFDIIGERLFEMSFIDLFFYIKEYGIVLRDKKLTLCDLNIETLYAFHLRICESFQACKVYGYDIPKGLEIIQVKNKPINVYGAIIMDFLYDNPVYQDLRWDELFAIVKKFVGFEDCDSEVLRQSATRFGYIEGSGQIQKKKKNYFFNN